jgi:hypothetical protein
MASVGPKSKNNSAKETDNGKLYFGDKDAAFLKKTSREAVEGHHNAPILFFAIDWLLSKRNLYGETLIKKFVNTKGVEVRGIYKIEEDEQTQTNGIPNKLMKLTVSVYTEHLQEIDIAPQLGDYFGIGKRLYRIVKKTIDDAGPGQLMMNRERMRQDFFAVQDDDEVLQKDIWGENLGLEQDIKLGNS